MPCSSDFLVTKKSGDFPVTGKSTRIVSPRWPDHPEYALGLAVVRRTILDALDGGGVQVLDGLFTPLAQVVLMRLLGVDEDEVEERTHLAVETLRSLIQRGDGHRARYQLVKGSLEGLLQVLGGDIGMKEAVDRQGNHIVAGPDAPAEATCPRCGWPVDLRRRRMPDGETWFWRHRKGAPEECPLRYRWGE